MTIPIFKGRYHARLAADAADLMACRRLRNLCFFGRPGLDVDSFDDVCRHLMVEDQTGRLVATLRLFHMPSGAEVERGYAARYYDLSRLVSIRSPMMEVGRFSVAPDVLDADVLRVTWGAVTQIVDTEDTAMLFGCTSFAGTDPDPYGKVFARLAARHQGPTHLRPAMRAQEVLPLADLDKGGAHPMPPLLRTYLAMGGWVGDHLVVDRVMDTLHVFTCLEVDAVPPGRAKALRGLAQEVALL